MVCIDGYGVWRDIEEIVQILDDYFHVYCEKRFLRSLGGLSPFDYRCKIRLNV